MTRQIRWTAALLVLMALFGMTAIVGAQNASCGAEYTVQPGDTLTRIANVCDTTVEALREANPTVFSLIRPGDVLRLTPAAAAANPVVALTPTVGAVGTPVTVVVNGFPAAAPVLVGMGYAGQTALVSSRAAADAQGALTLNLTVPGSATGGSTLYVTVQTQDGALSATSGGFVVTTPAQFGVGGATPPVAETIPVMSAAYAPIPAPAGVNAAGVIFDRVNVYMVGSGGAGVSTSCGDVLVPVQIVVNPTVAPLTVGLDALLNYSAADFGLTSVDNPLSRSSLGIEDVLIVSGEAIIQLNGTVTSAGVCEDARLRGQLEATALQYPTVDRVSIFVNGVLLDDLLP